MSELPNRFVFVFTDSLDTTDVQFNEIESLFRLSESQLANFRTAPLDRLLFGSPASKSEVLIGRFQQSCIVCTYAPRELLYKVIRRATYVHSCGLVVFASLIEASSVSKIRAALEGFVHEAGIKSFELSFFTQDRFGNEAGRLSGLLIDQERYFLGELPFDHAQEQLQNWVGAERIVPTDDDSEVDARIWVYKDVADTRGELPWSYPEKYDEIYLFVYQPLYRMRNALYTLDEAREAKPYWKGIDTTPQQLMGAMLNLAQMREGEDQVLLEPFAHTGTLVHEAVRLNLKRIYYNDKVETIGAKDNLDLLASPPDRLEEMIHGMKQIMSLDNSVLYDHIKEIAQDSLLWKGDEPYPEITTRVEDLIDGNDWLHELTSRVFFYLVRRFYIEQHIGYQPDSSNGRIPYYGVRTDFQTPGRLLAALDNFVEEGLLHLSNYVEMRKKIGTERSFRGLVDLGYNPIAYDRCQMLLDNEVPNVNIAKGIPLDSNSVDAIVTDPPYGYGSKELQQEINNLYRRFFEEAFRVLKPGGRIVMCVLDKVRTGKEVMGTIMTTGVVNMANDVARESQVEFLSDSLWPFERDHSLLSYWKAKHKLNRGILSFRIQKTVGN